MKAILVLWTFLIVLYDKQTRSSTSTVNYVHIGCFKDTQNRSMPELLGNWRSNRRHAIQECARATAHASYSAFGVQYGGECWSGPQAHMTFSMYGASRKCANRLGGDWTQDVYMFLNASIIANYDIKRCYEVDVTIHYRIPEGLTLSHYNVSTRFARLFLVVTSIQRFSQCSGISVTKGVLQTSPPGQSTVFVKQTVIFTASARVPDAAVPTKLTTCITYAKNLGKRILDPNIPSLSQNGVTYQAYNKSTISDKRSCCGGDIPPPCCAVGSVKVSSTECACLPGYHFVPGSLCVRCPKDTYQKKQGQTSCEQCPADKKTFGKTGASSASNCTANNPLQIVEMKTIYLPWNIRPGTRIVNVTVTGKLASLVQPFLYYIDKLAQLQQSSNSERRRRREAGDVCEEAGTIPPLNYFCIYRRSGQIIVTGDFSFKDGDEFELIVRVTDSDRLGKTENTAKVKFISRDDCRDIRTLYEEAVKFCEVDESLSPGRCPSVKCLQSLYNWHKAWSQSTDALRVDCSFGPTNLTALTQKYYNCIGLVVTLDPVSLKVRLGTPAVLTCNATSQLNLTIEWFKDGVSLKRFGNHLRINKVDYRNQGDYSCKFSTVVTGSFSKHASLLLDGVLTSIVSFTILNKKYDADLLELKIAIERNVENYLNSGGSPWNYIVKLSKFRDLSGKLGVDLVLYSEVKANDIVEYYAGIDKLLENGDINKIVSSLRISQKSITIRSATYCLPEETGKQSVKGVFEWKLTTVGQNTSLIHCPYGPPPAQAIRFCGGNFKAGGMWTHPDLSSCKYKSERTNKLNNLHKTAIDEMNVVEVTKEVKSLTSSPKEMNEADASLIADVIEDIVSLERSLNETGQDVLDVIDNVMNMKKGYLQESQTSNKASSKFVRALDKVAGSLPLSDGQPSRLLVAPSVAVQTNRVNPVSFNGLSLAVQTPTADPNKLTADSMVNEELPPKEVQTSITLPEALFQNKTPSNDAVKVGFVIYQNDIFFQPAVSDEEESIPSSVISKVGSSSVQDLTFQNLTQPVELVFQPAINVDESSGNAVCVFWDFDALGGLGNWSSRGCKRVNSETGRVKCHCDHMTNFAVLFSASGPTKHVGKHAVALSLISYVGCAISLVGLTITLLTYALFRNLRKTNQQPILMSLCVSLMLLLIVFIAGAGQTQNLIGCRIVAVLIHYFALSSVLWMGVEGYNMYMSFVQVMATYQSNFILKASAVAWGLSGIIVVITVSAATGYYGNDDFCVLHGVPFQAAMFAPVLLIILINFVIFFLALRSLSRTGSLVSAEKKSSSYQRARTSVAILILLGLTWVFGALAVSRAQLTFDYLFSIFNSLQGFIIFYFHCLRHQEVRNQWKWFLLGKGRRYHPSSSESHTGYPKTNSKANKNDISNSSPMRKSFGMLRRETINMNGKDASPKPPTQDIVPAEV